MRYVLLLVIITLGCEGKLPTLQQSHSKSTNPSSSCGMREALKHEGSFCVVSARDNLQIQYGIDGVLWKVSLELILEEKVETLFCPPETEDFWGPL